ncbi:hypothetical protein PFISCL1PPCAC_15704 [Pristionchus fissidentatus]|uniref:Cytochrome b-c1 complex subunit Rieske, mitochondrial n=1 Tax=Pristionchus fissidentatus TaxID=1538716 RepID=A0AAV5W089_9BILA|nr:hypothetical protein PFISCL1PPCAC_15704 [Pristionchus fissidentatus]
MASLVRSGTTASKIICGSNQQLPSNIGAALVASPKSVDVSAAPSTPYSMQKAVTVPARQNSLFTNNLAVKGVNVTSRRFAHTDVAFPDFSKYRSESTLDPSKPARDTEDARRALPVAVYYGVGGMMSLWAGKEVIQTMVSYKAMAADQRALASIEIAMADIPEGQTKTFEWRGKPVFVKHRTKAEIAREKAVPVADLRHPQHDDERVQKDEWSVVIGVCTHLGCVPIANSGDFGGYYCPCHGSHYDGSGRIRKGPAPLNLHVPAYAFKDNTIVIGSN